MTPDLGSVLKLLGDQLTAALRAELERFRVELLREMEGRLPKEQKPQAPQPRNGNDAMHPNLMYRFKDLRANKIVGDRKTLKGWMQRPSNPFPRPIRLGPRGIVWRAIEVNEWLSHTASPKETPR